MFKFGETAARSEKSFGVAGVLTEKSYVFYESLFSTLHLGRVTDLLAARLQSSGADELRLRALLLYSAFQAYRCGSVANPPVPMQIECGIDNEKIAIGINFKVSPEWQKDLQTLGDRLEKREPKNEFETLVLEIMGVSDRLLFRYQASTLRAEIVALLALPAMDPKNKTLTDSKFNWIEISEIAEDTPKAEVYQELGDLNYTELLKNESRKLGGAEEEETDTTLKGTTNHINDGSMTVKGGAPEDESVRTVSGSGVFDRSEALEKQLKLYEERIRELNKKIEAFEEERRNTKMIVSGSSANSQSTNNERITVKGGGAPQEKKSFWGKIMAIGKKEEPLPELPYGNSLEEIEGQLASEVDEEIEAVDAATQVDVKPDPKDKPKPKDETPEILKPNNSAEKEIQALTHDVEQGDFAQAVNKIYQQGIKFKEVIESDEGKAFIEGTVAAMIKEKLKLQKRLSSALKTVNAVQSEALGKVKTLTEELGKREDVIKNKTVAHGKLTDQVAQLNMEVERARTASRNSAADKDAKTKMAHMTKMIEASKSETAAAKKKVEELTASLSQTKQLAKSQRHDEYNELKSKFDKTTAHTEELKKMNKDLVEKMAAVEKKAAGPGGQKAVDELKEKLQQAVNLTITKKKEADTLALKVQQLENQLTNLKNATGGKAA